MLLKFETRCGCTREMDMPGVFNPPPVYIIPLKSKPIPASSYKSQPLDAPPDILTRVFKLRKVDHYNSYWPTAYYEEE